MTERVSAVVIGAGVVGLAIAARLAERGLEPIVLEAENAIGTGTSSRNSEVIHAGIYYPQGSLKARLCVEGKKRLYAYCAERGIAAPNCGKFIVATSDAQVETLKGVIAKAAANGVTDLRLMSAAEARTREPALACVAAVESPSTGIVDSHALMLSLQGDLERGGGMVAFNSPLVSAHVEADGIVITSGGDEAMTLKSEIVINSAGLFAQELARKFTGLPQDTVPPSYYAKGNYYALSGKSPFSRLIYPVPEAAGLGVHLTIDLGGQARFGPDVEWVQNLDYRVDPARADAFYAEIRKYWPALPDGALSPAYSGIRPKIQAPHESARDYLIHGPADHGVPGLVNLYGIESPGLTSSLAIAEYVNALI